MYLNLLFRVCIVFGIPDTGSSEAYPEIDDSLQRDHWFDHYCRHGVALHQLVGIRQQPRPSPLPGRLAECRQRHDHPRDNRGHQWCHRGSYVASAFFFLSFEVFIEVTTIEQSVWNKCTCIGIRCLFVIFLSIYFLSGFPQFSNGRLTVQPRAKCILLTFPRWTFFLFLGVF